MTVPDRPDIVFYLGSSEYSAACKLSLQFVNRFIGGSLKPHSTIKFTGAERISHHLNRPVLQLRYHNTNIVPKQPYAELYKTPRLTN